MAAHPQQPDTLRHTLTSPNQSAQEFARQGNAVAVDGALTVVGSALDDVGGVDCGVVKVYATATGELLHLLQSPNPAEGNRFGTSVGISGTRVVVGAIWDDTQGVNVGSAYVYDLAGEYPTDPISMLISPSLDANDNFGCAVAISGPLVVVGARGDDAEAPDAGRAYVYDLGSATPHLAVATLSKPSPVAEDQFGSAVAISGTRAVVGMQPSNPWSVEQGTVCVYELEGAIGQPAPIAILQNPNPSGYKTFGSAVAISDQWVAVGDHANRGADGFMRGTIYAYDLAGSTPTVPAVTLRSPNENATWDQFGAAVAISGTRVATATNRTDEIDTGLVGRGYVHDLASANPAAPTAVLTFPAPAAGGLYGYAVAIDEARVVVGVPGDHSVAQYAGGAYTFDLASATPSTPIAALNSPSPAAQDRFGTSAAMDGTRVIVGSMASLMSQNFAGAAQVYDLSSATPSVPVVTMNNPWLQANHQFGNRVAISGKWAVVSASGYNSVYVYDLTSAAPGTPVMRLNHQATHFGKSVALAGDLLVIGAPSASVDYISAGTVFVYDLTAENPQQPAFILPNPTPASAEQFGISVAIFGTTVIVGDYTDGTAGPYAGSAYVYNLAGATPGVPVRVLSNPDPSLGIGFGGSVAISGTRAAVGVFYPWSDRPGRVYSYDLSSASLEPTVVQLINPEPSSGDAFGASIAMSGTRVLVGSPGQDVPWTTRAGGARVFDLSSATPSSPVATLNNPRPTPGDLFGNAVAITGTIAVIGAPGEDGETVDRGAAYVFEPADIVREAPQLITPATGNGYGTSVEVSFSLPEAALPGSLKLTFAREGTVRVLTLADSEGSSGLHAFSFDPRNPAAVAQIVGGSAIPDGLYTVELAYQDEHGHSLVSASAAQVRIDTSGPIFGQAPADLLTVPQGGTVALPDYTDGVTASDVSGVASVTQNPAPGAPIGEGSTEITITAADALGNTNSTRFFVFVRVTGTSTLARKGGAIPNTNGDLRIPAGATWRSFGVPSITDLGQQAGWLATIQSPSRERFQGVFYGLLTEPKLRLLTGDPAFDADGAAVPDVTFASFREPVFAGDHFAVAGIVRGTGIKAANNTGIWFGNSTGTFEIAREGGIAEGAEGARFRAFTSILTTTGGVVFFTAQLTGDPLTARGLWTWSREQGVRLALRAGHPSAPGGPSVKSFRALGVVPGSPGHGHYEERMDAIGVWAAFADGRTAHLRVDQHVSMLQLVSGELDGYGLRITRLGPPSPSESGASGSLVRIAPDRGLGISPANTVAVQMDNQTLVHSGMPSVEPRIPNFAQLLKPVLGMGSGRDVAVFPAVLAGAPADRDRGIWAAVYRDEVAPVAREGQEPPGAPGTKWDSFGSLSVQDGRGALFIATLAAGRRTVDESNDRGLWATAADGNLTLITREGDLVDGRKLHSFSVLGAVAGSPGQRRAWTAGDESSRIIYRARFRDGSSAIICSAVP